VRIDRIDCLRQAEIEHLHDATRSDLDVRRLEIPMDDALFVGGFKRIGDLLGDCESLVNRQRPVLQPIGKRRTVDEFHYDSAVF
jgi:hypothetical protein